MFNINGKFMHFAMKAADLILLNLLTVICCIPVVTIGAAFSAMHYVLLRLYRDEDGGLLKSFFHAFTANLRQGIVLTLGYLLYFGILAADYALGSRTENPITGIIVYALPILLLLGALSLCWVFALQARYENTVWGTVKTSFAACIAHPIRSVAMTALMVLPFLLLMLTPYMVPALLLFSITLCGLLRVMLYSPVFQTLEKAPDTAEETGGAQA